MIPQDFRTQSFKTPEQWESGLMYRLDTLKTGGITLHSSHTFAQWIIKIEDGLINPAGLAVDECCQVFFIDTDADSNKCGLYRYDQSLQKLELLSYIEYHVSHSNKECPARIVVDTLTLWINDIKNRRILAFSRDTFQVKHTIDKYLINDEEELIEPIDVGLDQFGQLYILNGKPNNCQIIKYDTSGNFIQVFELNLKEPVGLALDEINNIWIIDKKSKKLIRFKENDSKIIQDMEIQLSEVYQEFQPFYITIDGKGTIFISDSHNGLIHQFDPDGNYIGKVPGFSGQVRGLFADSQGDLYISSNNGISRLSSYQTYSTEAGIYYSKTLDSGIEKCQWHRLALEAEIPPKSLLEIYYSLSDDPQKKQDIDTKLRENIPANAKAEFIDTVLKWNGPEKNPEDMLFKEKNGRYLWLKLKLLTFDEKVKPTITRMKVIYPRISYLRYLPEIYQENAISKEFLERFLSIFETANCELETSIDHIDTYFDPDTVPRKFLTWFASWLNVSLEEGWTEDKKRQFISEAYSLYKLKGTTVGMKKLIHIYTGKEPLILEHSKLGKPVVLGKSFILGIQSQLLKTPVRGFRLGDDSILGMAALRDKVQSLDELFLPMAHRFTIIIDLSFEEFTRIEKGLRQIIDDEKPAHTAYDLRFNDKRESMGTYVGVNTRLDYYEPLRLGVTATVGSGIILMKGEHSGKIEKHARLGHDTELI